MTQALIEEAVFSAEELDRLLEEARAQRVEDEPEAPPSLLTGDLKERMDAFRSGA